MNQTHEFSRKCVCPLYVPLRRTGYPYDNARCESFMKTLKQEEIRCRRYSTMDELRKNLEEFIDHYYNEQRLHSALAYRSPKEFELTGVA